MSPQDELPYALILDERFLPPIHENNIWWTRLFCLEGGWHSDYALQKEELAMNLEIFDGIRNFNQFESILKSRDFWREKAYILMDLNEDLKWDSESIEEHIRRMTPDIQKSPWLQKTKPRKSKQSWWRRNK